MPKPQPAIFAEMGRYQWYVQLSRVDGADVGHIKRVITDTRIACSDHGINITVGLGPGLLADLTDDVPDDFQPYETVQAIDGSGREARGTQEELLLWMNHDEKDLVWKTQWDVRQALRGHMAVARETPTFIYGDSLDMTGFAYGTGNPEPDRDEDVAIVPDRQPGAGGSFIIAQRWVHDLDKWEQLPVSEQEKYVGRTKADSERLPGPLDPRSHLAHVELRDEITRRSTPYAFHDGTVGLYFMAFCRAQAPLRERLDAMFGRNGQVRDALTDFSNPASGSYYFAPSLEVLDSFG